MLGRVTAPSPLTVWARRAFTSVLFTTWDPSAFGVFDKNVEKRTVNIPTTHCRRSCDLRSKPHSELSSAAGAEASSWLRGQDSNPVLLVQSQVWFPFHHLAWGLDGEIRTPSLRLPTPARFQVALRPVGTDGGIGISSSSASARLDSQTLPTICSARSVVLKSFLAFVRLCRRPAPCEHDSQLVGLPVPVTM